MFGAFILLRLDVMSVKALDMISACFFTSSPESSYKQAMTMKENLNQTDIKEFVHNLQITLTYHFQTIQASITKQKQSQNQENNNQCFLLNLCQ